MNESEREVLAYAAEFMLRLLSTSGISSHLSDEAMRLTTSFRSEFALAPLRSVDFYRLHRRYGNFLDDGGECMCFQSALAKLCADCARVVTQDVSQKALAHV